MRTVARYFLLTAPFVIAAGLILVPVGAPRADEGRPGIRDLYIVAHQDDDLLFMNPDLQDAIDAGHTIKTVFLTAGHNDPATTSAEAVPPGSPRVGSSAPYYLEREAGSLAAYATMAGVSNRWTAKERDADEQETEDGVPIEVSLVERPNISLVFFRLPIGDGTGAASGPGVFAVNLRDLWLGNAQTIPALDGSAAYTKDQLVKALTRLIHRFSPHLIVTQDSSGFNGTGRDPSGINIFFTGNTGECDLYDNSDHYYGATFARAAENAWGRTHRLRRYRGYNIGNEAPNVFGQDLARKKLVFQAYAERDTAIFSSHPPFCGPGGFCLYDNWQQRQYRVDVNNPPSYTTCIPLP